VRGGMRNTTAEPPHLGPLEVALLPPAASVVSGTLGGENVVVELHTDDLAVLGPCTAPSRSS
jgi:hypothetical protein